jgi:hypothetical protein
MYITTKIRTNGRNCIRGLGFGAVVPPLGSAAMVVVVTVSCPLTGIGSDRVLLGVACSLVASANIHMFMLLFIFLSLAQFTKIKNGFFICYNALYIFTDF